MLDNPGQIAAPFLSIDEAVAIGVGLCERHKGFHIGSASVEGGRLGPCHLHAINNAIAVRIGVHRVSPVELFLEVGQPVGVQVKHALIRALPGTSSGSLQPKLNLPPVHQSILVGIGGVVQSVPIGPPRLGVGARKVGAGQHEAHLSVADES